MPKRSHDAGEEKPKAITSYTIKLDDAQMEKLRAATLKKHWEQVEVPYARFAFKGPKVNVTAYTSGKVVVAGKDTEDFVQNVIEAEVTGAPKLGYDEVLHPDWFEAHAGLDESGKGDLFGPVVAATVIAGKEAVLGLAQAAGVRDSKTVVDTQILKLDELIRDDGRASSCRGPATWTMHEYNRVMARPYASLNRLLAQHHADALDAALKRKWVPRGLLDQFTKDPLVQRELKKLGARALRPRDAHQGRVGPRGRRGLDRGARGVCPRSCATCRAQFGDKLQKGAGAPGQGAGARC